MISKDQAIIMQVAAKIAADLIVKSENVEATCTDWELAFNFVNDKLQSTNAVDAAVQTIKEVFPEAQITEAPATYANSVVMAERVKVSSVKVVGAQHGDLPNWLIAACQKAGVGKVWDNRDKAAGTKRPWFKQADAPEGAEPAAFWPPKGQG
jgi:hypothetical protein